MGSYCECFGETEKGIIGRGKQRDRLCVGGDTRRQSRLKENGILGFAYLGGAFDTAQCTCCM